MMKKLNFRVISCFMAVMLVMVSVMIAPINVSAEAAVAQGKCGDNLTWTLDADGKLTISGTGDMWNFRYESDEPWCDYSKKITHIQINSGVTSIGSSAFFCCVGPKSIVIPDSVTSIGWNAFFCCTTLGSIVIPKGVTSIGNWAFGDCRSLKSVVISDSVTSIGTGAFYKCGSLMSIQVDENNPNYTSLDGVLYAKDKTQLICCPGRKSEIEIPNSVTNLADYAFYDCKELKSVVIPNGVTCIGSNAFYKCYNLTSIVIPDSVTRIGEKAFVDCCSLTGIQVDKNNPSYASLDGVLYTKDMSRLIWYPRIKGEIEIPVSVTNIADYAFAYCYNLTNIVIPDGVTRIENNAFYKCYNLTSIVIPDSVTHIGYYAFSDCDKLTLFGTNGSYAQKYANDYDIPFTVCVNIGNKFLFDVKPGAWYLEAVKYTLDNGLFFGVSPKMFAPDTPMNRAMLATVLWRMEGQPTVSAENPFKDVPSGEWYTDAVRWAASNSIVCGVSDDEFDPMGNITREQAASILYRYSQHKGYDISKTADLNAFPDAEKTSDYAVTELAWAYGEGLIMGVRAGDTDYLEPQSGATRAQVATILMRYIENFTK